MSLNGGKLIYINSDGVAGAEYCAKGRKFVVGYYVSCDVLLAQDRDQAKGVHCEIKCDAFGRVTIENFSEEYPILVDGRTISDKRPLKNGTYIEILGAKYIWKFPTKLTSNDVIESPEKQFGIPEQLPNSCPELKKKRRKDPRLTFHNFSYNIHFDEDGNTTSSGSNTDSAESPESSFVIQGQYTPTSETPEGSVVIHGQHTPAAEYDFESVRSTTPDQPLPNDYDTELPESPIVKSLEYNKGKENIKEKMQQLSLCHSEILLTSYIPDEMEQSFVKLRPNIQHAASDTPRSVYSTPKSVASESECNMRDILDFSSTKTSPYSGKMHHVDLTRLGHTMEGEMSYPEEPQSPVSRITSSGSMASVISVDSNDDSSSSVIVLLSESETNDTPQHKTPKTSKPTGGGTPKSAAATPRRHTPHSLRKRALLTSANKQGKLPTPSRLKQQTPLTPKDAESEYRRNALLVRPTSLTTSKRKPQLNTKDFEKRTPAKQVQSPTSSKRALLMANSAKRVLMTSTPVPSSSVAPPTLTSTTKSSNTATPLTWQRKSMIEHSISPKSGAFRKSLITNTRTSSSSLSSISNKLLTKARKSLSALSPNSARARALSYAASKSIIKRRQSLRQPSANVPDCQTISTTTIDTNSPLEQEEHSSDELGRTYLIEDSSDEGKDTEQKSKRKDATFSPKPSEQAIVLDDSIADVSGSVQLNDDNIEMDLLLSKIDQVLNKSDELKQQESLCNISMVDGPDPDAASTSIKPIENKQQCFAAEVNTTSKESPIWDGNTSDLSFSSDIEKLLNNEAAYMKASGGNQVKIEQKSIDNDEVQPQQEVESSSVELQNTDDDKVLIQQEEEVLDEVNDKEQQTAVLKPEENKEILLEVELEKEEEEKPIDQVEKEIDDDDMQKAIQCPPEKLKEIPQAEKKPKEENDANQYQEEVEKEEQGSETESAEGVVTEIIQELETKSEDMNKDVVDENKEQQQEEFTKAEDLNDDIPKQEKTNKEGQLGEANAEDLNDDIVQCTDEVDVQREQQAETEAKTDSSDSSNTAFIKESDEKKSEDHEKLSTSHSEHEYEQIEDVLDINEIDLGAQVDEINLREDNISEKPRRSIRRRLSSSSASTARATPGSLVQSADLKLQNLEEDSTNVMSSHQEVEEVLAIEEVENPPAETAQPTPRRSVRRASMTSMNNINKLTPSRNLKLEASDTKETHKHNTDSFTPRRSTRRLSSSSAKNQIDSGTPNRPVKRRSSCSVPENMTPLTPRRITRRSQSSDDKANISSFSNKLKTKTPKKAATATLVAVDETIGDMDVIVEEDNNEEASFGITEKKNLTKEIDEPQLPISVVGVVEENICEEIVDSQLPTIGGVVEENICEEIVDSQLPTIGGVVEGNICEDIVDSESDRDVCNSDLISIINNEERREKVKPDEGGDTILPQHDETKLLNDEICSTEVTSYQNKNTLDDQETIEPSNKTLNQSEHDHDIDDDDNKIDYYGLSDLLKTPRGCSTPRFKGTRQSPKLCGIEEPVETQVTLAPVSSKSLIPPLETQSAHIFKLNQTEDEGLDKFFKTPRAKNLMIPNDPASAVLQSNSNGDGMELVQSTEYNLNATNDASTHLGKLFDTPVSTTSRFAKRLHKEEDYEDEQSHQEKTIEFDSSSMKVEISAVSVAETPKRSNRSSEEAFDQLIGSPSELKTPVDKIYRRNTVKSTTPQQLSPFSATDVITDLAKTDVQQWVESLEKFVPEEGNDDNNDVAVDSDNTEIEVSLATVSGVQDDQVDPLHQSKMSASLSSAAAASSVKLCSKIYLTCNNNADITTGSEKLMDVSTISSIRDPLTSTAYKPSTSTMATIAKDLDLTEATEQEKCISRPLTPAEEGDISGLQLLDETTESVMEPLMVSSCVDSFVEIQDKSNVALVEVEPFIIDDTSKVVEKSYNDTLEEVQPAYMQKSKTIDNKPEASLNKTVIKDQPTNNQQDESKFQKEEVLFNETLEEVQPVYMDKKSKDPETSLENSMIKTKPANKQETQIQEQSLNVFMEQTVLESGESKNLVNESLITKVIKEDSQLLNKEESKIQVVATLDSSQSVNKQEVKGFDNSLNATLEETLPAYMKNDETIRDKSMVNQTVEEASLQNTSLFNNDLKEALMEEETIRDKSMMNPIVDNDFKEALIVSDDDDDDYEKEEAHVKTNDGKMNDNDIKNEVENQNHSIINTNDMIINYEDQSTKPNTMTPTENTSPNNQLAEDSSNRQNIEDDSMIMDTICLSDSEEDDEAETGLDCLTPGVSDFKNIQSDINNTKADADDDTIINTDNLPKVAKIELHTEIIDIDDEDTENVDMTAVTAAAAADVDMTETKIEETSNDNIISETEKIVESEKSNVNNAEATTSQVSEVEISETVLKSSNNNIMTEQPEIIESKKSNENIGTIVDDSEVAPVKTNKNSDDEDEAESDQAEDVMEMTSTLKEIPSKIVASEITNENNVVSIDGDSNEVASKKSIEILVSSKNDNDEELPAQTDEVMENPFTLKEIPSKIVESEIKDKNNVVSIDDDSDEIASKKSIEILGSKNDNHEEVSAQTDEVVENPSTLKEIPSNIVESEIKDENNVISIDDNSDEIASKKSIEILVSKNDNDEEVSAQTDEVVENPSTLKEIPSKIVESEIKDKNNVVSTDDDSVEIASKKSIEILVAKNDNDEEVSAQTDEVVENPSTLKEIPPNIVESDIKDENNVISIDDDSDEITSKKSNEIMVSNNEEDEEVVDHTEDNLIATNDNIIIAQPEIVELNKSNENMVVSSHNEDEVEPDQTEEVMEKASTLKEITSNVEMTKDRSILNVTTDLNIVNEKDITTPDDPSTSKNKQTVENILEVSSTSKDVNESKDVSKIEKSPDNVSLLIDEGKICFVNQTEVKVGNKDTQKETNLLEATDLSTVSLARDLPTINVNKSSKHDNPSSSKGDGTVENIEVTSTSKDTIELKEEDTKIEKQKTLSPSETVSIIIEDSSSSLDQDDSKKNVISHHKKYVDDIIEIDDDSEESSHKPDTTISDPIILDTKEIHQNDDQKVSSSDKIIITRNGKNDETIKPESDAEAEAFHSNILEPKIEKVINLLAQPNNVKPMEEQENVLRESAHNLTAKEIAENETSFNGSSTDSVLEESSLEGVTKSDSPRQEEPEKSKDNEDIENIVGKSENEKHIDIETPSTSKHKPTPTPTIDLKAKDSDDITIAEIIPKQDVDARNTKSGSDKNEDKTVEPTIKRRGRKKQTAVDSATTATAPKRGRTRRIGRPSLGKTTDPEEIAETPAKAGIIIRRTGRKLKEETLKEASNNSVLLNVSTNDSKHVRRGRKPAVATVVSAEPALDEQEERLSKTEPVTVDLPEENLGKTPKRRKLSTTIVEPLHQQEPTKPAEEEATLVKKLLEEANGEVAPVNSKKKPLRQGRNASANVKKRISLEKPLQIGEEDNLRKTHQNKPSQRKRNVSSNITDSNEEEEDLRGGKRTNRTEEETTLVEKPKETNKVEKKRTARRGRKASPYVEPAAPRLESSVSANVDLVNAIVSSVDAASAEIPEKQVAVKKPLRRGRKAVVKTDEQSPSGDFHEIVVTTNDEVGIKKQVRRGRNAAAMEAEKRESRNIPKHNYDETSNDGVPTVVTSIGRPRRKPKVTEAATKQVQFEEAPAQQIEMNPITATPTTILPPILEAATDTPKREGRNLPRRNYSETSDDESAASTPSRVRRARKLTSKALQLEIEKAGTPKKVRVIPPAEEVSATMTEGDVTPSKTQATHSGVRGGLKLTEESASYSPLMSATNDEPSTSKKARAVKRKLRTLPTEGSDVPPVKLTVLQVDAASSSTPARKKRGRPATEKAPEGSETEQHAKEEHQIQLQTTANAESVDGEEKATGTTKTKRGRGGARKVKPAESEEIEGNGGEQPKKKPTKRGARSKINKEVNVEDEINDKISEPVKKRGRKPGADTTAVEDAIKNPQNSATKSRSATRVKHNVVTPATTVAVITPITVGGTKCTIAADVFKAEATARSVRGRKVHFETAEDSTSTTHSEVSHHDTPEPSTKRTTRPRRK